MNRSQKKKQQTKLEQMRLQHKKEAQNKPEPQEKKRTYNNPLQKTDADIPVFSYKSAAIILLCTFIPLIVVPNVCNWLKVDFRLPTVFITGLVSGFTVVSTQYFIESKRGFSSKFWLVGLAVSCFVWVLLFIAIYAGVIM